MDRIVSLASSSFWVRPRSLSCPVMRDRVRLAKSLRVVATIMAGIRVEAVVQFSSRNVQNFIQRRRLRLAIAVVHDSVRGNLLPTLQCTI